MKQFLLICICCNTLFAVSQTAEEQVLEVKSRLDSIQSFSAAINLHVDIPFIQMPDKEAVVDFNKGENLKIQSEGFTLIPKRGLDLSFRELFEYPFIAVARGEVTTDTKRLHSYSILPTNDIADFSVATLHIDLQTRRIVWAEISTKKDGTYILQLKYPSSKAILPTRLEVSFEMDRIRIPLNFAGKDVEVDRKKMRETDQKAGKIILDLEYSTIKKIQ